MTDENEREAVGAMVSRAKHLLDYASADCSECGCSGASFGHGSAVEVGDIIERLAALCQSTDALKIAREALRGMIDLTSDYNLDSEQAGRAYAALKAIDAALEQST